MESMKAMRCKFKKCKKKVNLMGFDCKCGNRYCIKHFQPEFHICNYDHKNKMSLEKKLIKVEAAKVPPI